MKAILGWVGIAVVIAVAVGLLVRSGGDAAVIESNMDEVFVIRDTDHVKGDRDNPVVTIIEYSDFQCPACNNAHTKYFMDLEKDFPTGVALVYRHFPLTMIHRNADEAARASEAAALQGKFWEMHDALFAQQDAWSDAVDVETAFADYAEQLSMDRAQFLADYKSDVVKDTLKRYVKEANALGLSSTPTIYVNGELAQLPGTREALYAALRERLGVTEENMAADELMEEDMAETDSM